MTTRTGRCLCGGIHYEAKKLPERFGACHCAQCRHWAGGPLMAITVQPDALTLTGTPRAYRSSDWAERVFCPDCGGNLFYRITAGPLAGQIHLAVGTLDDLSGLRLDSEIFCDQTAGAYAFAGDLTRMTSDETRAFFGSLAAEG